MRLLFLLAIFLLLITCDLHRDNAVESKLQHTPALGYISVDNAKSDLTFLFDTLEKVHFNPYLYKHKSQMRQEIKNLQDNWNKYDSIPVSQFAIDIMKLAAQIGDGHTNLIWYSNNLLPNRDSMLYFPIQMKINEKNDLLITDDHFPRLSGKTVKLINGNSAASLYKEALSCLPGNYFYTQEINEALFFPIYLYLRGIKPPYTVKLDSDKTIEIPKTDGLPFIDLYKRLQPSSENYEYKPLDNHIGYIAYNSCTDYEAFDLFLKETFNKIHQTDIKALIVDIRNNSGGNSALNDLLIPYISDKAYRQGSKRLWKISAVSKEELISRGVVDEYGEDFIQKFRQKQDTTILDFGDTSLIKVAVKPKYFFNGKTCFLIGPKTFSSANMLANAVSAYQLSTLIGKPTGERKNDFGEQKTLFLPKSGLPFNHTIAYDIGANGDPNDKKTVQPDIYVEGDALPYAKEWLLKRQ